MHEIAAAPAARLEELTSLYERQAYVAWNVALRTAGDEEAAAAAVRRAFLGQVAAPDEQRVPLDLARLAIEAARPVDSRQIDEPVLAATAHLAPVARAALALPALADSSSEQVARALGIDRSTEQDLRHRAYAQLAALLGVSESEAQSAYADLPWIEPPPQLWEALYPELHAAVTEQPQVAGEEARPVSAPVAPTRKRRSALAAGLGRAGRVPRLALAGLALLALAGVAWAATGGGSTDDGSGTEAGEYSAIDSESGGSSYSSPEDGTATTEPGGGSGERLSAEELDRLRRQEKEDLARYNRQRVDKQLSPRQRRRAARKAKYLVTLARRRERASQRDELRLRQQLAREREARMRERNRAPQQNEQSTSEQKQPDREPQPRDEQPKPQPGEGRDDTAPTKDDESDTECLYDADSGSYICPE